MDACYIDVDCQKENKLQYNRNSLYPKEDEYPKIITNSNTSVPIHAQYIHLYVLHRTVGFMILLE